MKNNKHNYAEHKSVFFFANWSHSTVMQFVYSVTLAFYIWRLHLRFTNLNMWRLSYSTKSVFSTDLISCNILQSNGKIILLSVELQLAMLTSWLTYTDSSSMQNSTQDPKPKTLDSNDHCTYCNTHCHFNLWTSTPPWSKLWQWFQQHNPWVTLPPCSHDPNTFHIPVLFFFCWCAEKGLYCH